MKIRINYDLFEKIQESNTGLSLNKSCKHVLKHTVISSIIFSIISILSNKKPIISDDTIIFFLVFHLMTKFPVDLILSKLTKKDSIKDLNFLVNMLNYLDINTSYELLQEAYLYKTSYKINKNLKNMPILIQNKYLMLPVNTKEEISLVQEHIVGTNNYYLSYGSPDKKKVLKLATNQI